MTAEEIADRPKELSYESRFQLLTRLGFLGRGMLYILIGYLVIRTGRTEDLTGALEYLGRGSGRILLIAIAVGMATYGLWRMADAAFGIENPGDRGKALRKRAAAGGIGLIYLYLCYKAVGIVLAGRTGTMTTQEQADTVLDLPGGAWVLGFAAVWMAGAGLVQLRKAGKCSFLDPLDDRACTPVIKWVGRLGYAARGIIFLLVGYLIGRAALNHRSTEAGGMERALDLLSGPMLVAVAAGLILFGAFSIVEALFRRIHQPPVTELEQDVREKLSR